MASASSRGRLFAPLAHSQAWGSSTIQGVVLSPVLNSLVKGGAFRVGQAILLTGKPGSGKTTLIRRVLERLSAPAGGFYTQEIREGGTRKGFEIITLDGRRATMAHVDIRGPHRVGRYGVDVGVVDELAVEAIQAALARHELVVIDEIGPMEILSARFRHVVREALESGSPILGSVVQRSTPFTDPIKATPGVRVLEVTRHNRDVLLPRVLAMLLEFRV